MYPWESADMGVEETPVWALSGTFEHHISADVALAAWQYYCVTQDQGWLREKGWPILSATADFWASRVERNGPGRYDIRNVVAADEWAENVDNDAFTNAAAQVNLRNAAAAAKLLGLRANPDWLHVAQNIPILKMADGTTREHATYQGEGIKQGDVNLLAYPLNVVTAPAQIRKDLEYYETRVPTAGTPAMTQAIFALLYARLGNAEKAKIWFKDAYEPNLLPPFRVIAETKGGTNLLCYGCGRSAASRTDGFWGTQYHAHRHCAKQNHLTHRLAVREDYRGGRTAQNLFGKSLRNFKVGPLTCTTGAAARLRFSSQETATL
ncbi:hypothetical protein [Hymenobacter sp. AT01-02]|uniref:hypothetical protein n=1 Tax=Hymenobacter sp. AT01-02 TaxID=1571877 RepID=UPI0021CD28FC|nr:hypothetical protein [Hymenobacter sp. AT01-02]